MNSFLEGGRGAPPIPYSYLIKTPPIKQKPQAASFLGGGTGSVVYPPPPTYFLPFLSRRTFKVLAYWRGDEGNPLSPIPYRIKTPWIKHVILATIIASSRGDEEHPLSPTSAIQTHFLSNITYKILYVYASWRGHGEPIPYPYHAKTLPIKHNI